MSFSAINHKTARTLMATLNPVESKVLYTLATVHANTKGIVIASVRSLEESSKLHRNTVAKYLHVLAAKGWIALHKAAGRDPHSGQRTAAEYQVSPHLLNLFGEARDWAMKNWIVLNGCDRQPDSEPEVEIYSEDGVTEDQEESPVTTAMGHNNNNNLPQEPPRNNLPEQPPTTTNKALEMGKTNVGAAIHTTETPQPQPRKSKSEGQKRTPNPAPAANSVASPKESQDAQNITKVTGRYPHIEPIGKALPDPAAERLAERIRDKCKVALKLARGLVTTYAEWKIRFALEQEWVQNAERPGGALRKQLHLLGDDPAEAVKLEPAAQRQQPDVDPFFDQATAPWIER